jgi:putative hydrolase of the HAD superfamily
LECNVTNIKAVLWDFGGVITSSPFDGFTAYEQAAGLPDGLIRDINTNNPDTNAWAQFERSDIDRDGFCRAFEAEAAAIGYTVSGEAILAGLAGKPRPIMVRALQRVRERFQIACLTNNVAKTPRPPEIEAEITAIMNLFGHVIESSKIGSRKPEERFYRHALETVGVTANEAVFLDDLGVNLKSARAIGMTTIKVSAPEPALASLGDLLGMDLLNDA